ncbi:MAG: hypothetical protein L0323_15085 [Planctomycetes bacterium]|nr:hypothetical protein [Planctomycetota bacterium]
MGPPGPEGAAGATGATGPTGPQGPEGALRFFVPLITSQVNFDDAPPAGVEILSKGGSRYEIDLTTAVKVVGQINFSVVPAATGSAIFEYSDDDGATWSTLLDMGTGYAADTLKRVAGNVPAGALVSNCLLRVVVTGDSAADPECYKAGLMFQP